MNGTPFYLFSKTFETTSIVPKKKFVNKPKRPFFENNTSFKETKPTAPSSTRVQASTSEKKIY
jgi:hypothetical protein